MSDLADEDAANYVYEDASPEESDEVENPVDSEEGESKGEDGGFSWNGFDHVRQMQEQNRTLIVMLEQEKAKVKKLKSELSIYQAVGKDDSPDIREKRLIELAKKNRNLNLALEREKLSNAKLQAELRKTKENIPAITATEQTSSPTSPKADAVKDQVEDIEFKYKETKEKLNQATNKLMDLRVQNESLKAELGRTQRALQKEVGDDVPLSKILEDSSGWKGRAQQISILKAKVSELKQSLGMPLGSSVAPSTYAPSVYQPSETASIRPSSAKTAATFDDRHREVIETKVKNARLEADKLTSDLVSKTEEANQYKMKYDASQARIKTLENEIRSLKNKIQVLIEKTETDDQLVDMLKQEIERRKANPPQKTKVEKGGQQNISDEATKRRVKEQELQIERQEQIILALRNELQNGRSGLNVRVHQISESDKLVLAESQLAVENERLKELVSVYKKKLQEP